MKFAQKLEDFHFWQSRKEKKNHMYIIYNVATRPSLLNVCKSIRDLCVQLQIRRGRRRRKRENVREWMNYNLQFLFCLLWNCSLVFQFHYYFPIRMIYLKRSQRNWSSTQLPIQLNIELRNHNWNLLNYYFDLLLNWKRKKYRQSTPFLSLSIFPRYLFLSLSLFLSDAHTDNMYVRHGKVKKLEEIGAHSFVFLLLFIGFMFYLI